MMMMVIITRVALASILGPFGVHLLKFTLDTYLAPTHFHPHFRQHTPSPTIPPTHQPTYPPPPIPKTPTHFLP